VGGVLIDYCLFPPLWGKLRGFRHASRLLLRRDSHHPRGKLWGEPSEGQAQDKFPLRFSASLGKIPASRIDKKNRRGAEGCLVSRWWLVCGIKNSAEQSVCYNVGVLFVVCNADVLCREYKSNFVTICPLLEDQQCKSHFLVEGS
jgi:hypothetical protein